MSRAQRNGERLAGSGLSYPRLVPSSLLPPEDPTSGRSAPRTVRDWIVDVFALLFGAGVAVPSLLSTLGSGDDRIAGWTIGLDVLLGVVAVVSLWWRRSRPIEVGVLTAVLTVVSACAAPASIVGLFSVAVHRRTGYALGVAGINVVTAAVFPLWRDEDTSYWVTVLISAVIVVIVLAWGMFVRARRQLVWTLRERAERAEAEQRMLADQARTAERSRIAREMHDVLAHRISLMALHAGGLQVRPDLPAAQVRETADLLRSTAQQALEELRGVIGVLRGDGGGSTGALDALAPAPPQPTLRDIPRLVEDTRRAGAKIDFSMDVPAAERLPDTVGRDAYRIVQEALTNVAKHARGTATVVDLRGAPGDGLHIDIRNRLPVAAGDRLAGLTLPGSGSGLLGLRERVALAGGSIEHGPNDRGEFVVDATLAWR